MGDHDRSKMIIRRGYVFIAQKENFQAIFGKPVNTSFTPENIENNDFLFFDEEGNLRPAIEEFRKSHPVEVFRATLEMMIAESSAEIDTFEGGNLVVVYDISLRQGDKITYLDQQLLGPRVEGKLDKINGICARIGFTDFETFSRLGDCYAPGTARYVAEEAARQSEGVPVTIAQFKLKRI